MTMTKHQSYKELKAQKLINIEVPDAPLRLHPDNLETSLKQKEAGLVVIDVRGEDFKGGHIPGSINLPYEELTERAEEIATAHHGAHRLVFLCMNSQVRAPSCAATVMAKIAELPEPRPEVFVLIGGFAGWVKTRSADPELVTDYDEKLWTSIWDATKES
eukprot:TRINITY_DN94637_c0_g1_i1.p1 TRINITY_DN94637_c0_g1~~TRINITY_DN94637_c0_g1_i1.p1  ORF type:complete len:169 (+),score=36.58 TRINITY_DN94637_c0_g1_i1:28-507(+)